MGRGRGRRRPADRGRRRQRRRQPRRRGRPARPRRAGPAIAFQLLVYPVTDHDFSNGSYDRYGEAGLLLGRREMQWFWDHYAPEEDQWAHPYATPLQADLGDLPPAYVVIAEHDPLRDEGLAYADRLAAAGVPVETRIFGDQLHVFFQLVNYFESANEAVAEAGAAVRAGLEAAG
ncbi:MAG: alpha/beta hydrolase fold domain-containing protein [Thermoleophilia bacterium]